MNRILTAQNSEPQLRRLGAQRWLYSRAKSIFLGQVAVSGPLAVGLTLVGLAIPTAKPYFAAWGLAVSLADVLWLSRRQKALRETAAKIQEAFDCDVLELPWHELKAGKPVDPELISSYSRSYDRVAAKFGPLHDWYPAAVGVLPIASARVLCQRANCWWDARQRVRYTALMQLAIGALLVAGVGSALAFNMAMTAFFVTVAGPFSPLLLLGIRQIVENRDATLRLEKLRDHASSLWKDVLARTSASALGQASRALQDEIFDARRRSPPVLDFLYERLRSGHELDMREAVEDAVRSAAQQEPESSNAPDQTASAR
jgi:hypothetical protein